MKIFEHRDASLWALLIAAIGLYTAYWTHFYPGYFGDDAAYLSGAQSLLHGSFRALYIVGSPAETHFLPGFPLALSPFLIFFHPTNPLLRCVPLLSTTLATLFMALFSRRWTADALGWIAVFLFAFNPVTAQYASTFMSEPFFTAISVASFCLLAHVLESDSAVSPWALAIGVAWTMLTRPIGVIIWPCVVIALALSRRWRALAISTGVPLVIWALWILRNHAASGSANDYVRFWGKEFSSLPSLLLLAQNFWNVLREMCVDHVLNLAVWLRPDGLIGSLFTFGVIGLWLVGVTRTYRSSPAHRPLLIAVMLYVCLYIAVHGLWLTFQDRYALPLLPFLLVFFLLGVEGLLSLWPARRWSPLLILILLLPGLVAEHRILLAETFSASRPPESLPPRVTMSWLETSLPSEEIICARSPAQVYLFTGRAGIGEPIAHDREEARFLLLKASMHTVLLEGGSLLSLSGDSPANQEANEERFANWVRNWPDVFHRVYENKDEGTSVYRLERNDLYTYAYMNYLAARSAFSIENPVEGFADLDRALKAYPDFASAFSLYGAALFIKGTDLSRAEHYLQKALKIMPDYPMARFYLEKVEIAQHPSSPSHGN